MVLFSFVGLIISSAQRFRNRLHGGIERCFLPYPSSNRTIRAADRYVFLRLRRRQSNRLGYYRYRYPTQRNSLFHAPIVLHWLKGLRPVCGPLLEFPWRDRTSIQHCRRRIVRLCSWFPPLLVVT